MSLKLIYYLRLSLEKSAISLEKGFIKNFSSSGSRSAQPWFGIKLFSKIIADSSPILKLCRTAQFACGLHPEDAARLLQLAAFLPVSVSRACHQVLFHLLPGHACAFVGKLTEL
jgi:hypothetical protein